MVAKGEGFEMTTSLGGKPAGTESYVKKA